MSSSDNNPSDNDAWPALAYADWQDTCATLHLWTQVVGKVKLALAPLVQSLVGHRAVRHRARAHHRRDAVPRSRAADRFRFLRP